MIARLYSNENFPLPAFVAVCRAEAEGSDASDLDSFNTLLA